MKNELLHLKTIGALREFGYTVLPVKEEIRRNLIRKIRAGDHVFPGIIGFDHSVIPEIYNALLSRHDFILLGLRGQAKSRIIRMLPTLLDEFVPIIKGCEINDNPYRPLCRRCHNLVAEQGDEVEIEWIGADNRYGEKLATPDVTMADLIGDIDPIKAAVQRLHYAHEGVIHFGIIPRTNRGIFAINELPDLQPRIQVGLFNLMQEKDIQIRGFPVRIPIDILMVYSANPEDYTNRGSIITPLKDRIGSQILTHYPRDIQAGMAITAQEAWVERDSLALHIPQIIREVIEATAMEARQSEFVDQKSGVSARMTISMLENAVSNAERRAYRHGEKQIVPRICDLFGSLSAITGKIELVYEGEQEGVTNVAKGLLGKAMKQVFLSYFPEPFKAAKKGNSPYTKTINYFKGDRKVDLSDALGAAEFEKRLGEIPGLLQLVQQYMKPAKDTSEEELAVLMEFVLEGLHQNSMLSKDEFQNIRTYGDMLQQMFDGLNEDDDDDLEELDRWA